MGELEGCGLIVLAGSRLNCLASGICMFALRSLSGIFGSLLLSFPPVIEELCYLLHVDAKKILMGIFLTPFGHLEEFVEPSSLTHSFTLNALFLFILFFWLVWTGRSLMVTNYHTVCI